MLNKYLKGKGIDVSKYPDYSVCAKWFYQTPGNLYRPGQFFPLGSLDFVYSATPVTETKFWKILLKEWFDLVKVGGYVVCSSGACPANSFEKNQLATHASQLQNQMQNMFTGVSKIEVVEDFLIIKKIKNSLSTLGSINEWTFGIITGGNRPQEVKAFVESVRAQKIPKYEIIISGNWREDLGKDVIVLDRAKEASVGCITKMKNAICQRAKYENIAIAHDRLILDKFWFKGFKLYGNNFEIVSCPQLDRDRKRAGDWLALNGPKDMMYNTGALEYDDWDETAYFSGTITIIKKSIWKKYKWDEALFWNKGEDIELSFRLRDAGFVNRINPYSKTHVTSWRHGAFPLHKRNMCKLGPKQGSYIRRFVWFFLRPLNRIPNFHGFIDFVFKRFIEKTKLNSFIVSH